MTRSNDSIPVSDMSDMPVPSRSYAAARSASFRPQISLVSFEAGRHSRAIRLSWVGLIRR